MSQWQSSIILHNWKVIEHTGRPLEDHWGHSGNIGYQYLFRQWYSSVRWGLSSRHTGLPLDFHYITIYYHNFPFTQSGCGAVAISRVEIYSFYVVIHDDIIKWRHFPRYWPFVRGIRRSPVNSPHKGQRRGALMFSLICAWINSWVNNREAGELRRHRAHYDVIAMIFFPTKSFCLMLP